MAKTSKDVALFSSLSYTCIHTLQTFVQKCLTMEETFMIISGYSVTAGPIMGSHKTSLLARWEQLCTGDALAVWLSKAMTTEIAEEVSFLLVNPQYLNGHSPASCVPILNHIVT